jgi:hypothetical protein
MTWRGALYTVAATALIVGIGGVYYAVAVQPDPQVRTIPMSWQTRETARPVLNTGVDKEGRTLDQFVAAGGKSQDYRPVETTTVQAGRAMYILRYQEFRNKLAEPTISRKLLCGRVTMRNGAPVVDVDGMVPYDLGSIPAPSRTDGAAVKNHPTPLPRWIMLDAEGKVIAQPRTCVYQASAKFIVNPVRSTDLQFAAVAVTVAPPSPDSAPAERTGAGAPGGKR